jgi:plasmid stabilization system protein ParE
LVTTISFSGFARMDYSLLGNNVLKDHRCPRCGLPSEGWAARQLPRADSGAVREYEQLASFPVAGRSGRVRDTRELVISNTPFIAAYAVDHERIVVLAIYHGAQQWPEAF